MPEHETYMHRCLALAGRGLGAAAPNPMAGCVIECGGSILGEGFHRAFGEAHAEVNALESVRDKSALARATLYVSLEPCAHSGKTPPCTDAIIAHGIPRVVTGCRDPFPAVNGRGIESLRAAGIEVTEGVLQEECRDLNRRFFTYHEKKRPYIILKWAQSADGCLAPPDEAREPGQPAWISGELSRSLVHQWRSEEQAVAAGGGTVLADNPMLTVRGRKGRPPMRVVTDREDKLPETLHVFDGSAPTLVLTEREGRKRKGKAEMVTADLLRLPQELCRVLHERDITSVLVEGGRRTLDAFLSAGLWDEARVFTSPARLPGGLPAPVLSAAAAAESVSGDDVLRIYRNNRE